MKVMRGFWQRGAGGQLRLVNIGPGAGKERGPIAVSRSRWDFIPFFFTSRGEKGEAHFIKTVMF